jgi:hypothetical protein
MGSDTRLWDEREEPLVRFLLGDLPAPERETLEARLFEDRGFLDEILAVTDDLIDAYLAGSLAPPDAARFEAHFLAAPRHRERFELMRDVIAATQEAGREGRVRRFVFWSLTAAAVLVAAMTAALLRRAPTPEQTVRLSTPTPRPAETKPAVVPVETEVVRVSARTDRPIEIPLSMETKTVRLEVPILDDRHPTYDAWLRSLDGAAIWSARGLVPPASGHALVVSIPARLLTAADYALVVRGEILRDAPRASDAERRYTLHIERTPEGYRQSP